MWKFKIQTCFFLLLTLQSLFLTAQTDSMPTAPTEKYSDFNVAPVSSQVNIPLNIDRWELEQSINKKVTGILYEDYSYEDNNNDNLMVKAMKSSDIKIGFFGQQINYIVPLSIWVKKKIAFTELEGTGDIIIKFVTDFSVKDDWSLETKTHVESYQWTKTPMLKTMGVEVPVKYIADIVLDKSKGKLAAAIDEQVKKTLNLQKNIKTLGTPCNSPF